MKPLILDQPAQQALPARFFWGTLTAVGWGAWIFLWMPALRVVSAALRVNAADLDAAGQSSSMLLGDFASHLNIAVALISVFVSWAICQRLRALHEDRSSEDRSVTADRLACSVKLRESDLRLWQKARRMIVTHDEALGWIRNVEVSVA